MTLNIFSLVLDGMPFLRYHLPVFEKLPFPWKWVVVHGTARNVGSTSWCANIPARLSRDGSTEYLKEIFSHPNVTVLEREEWSLGKDQMVQAAMEQFSEEGVVMQLDIDEIYTVEAIIKAMEVFERLPYVGKLQLKCRYYLGRDIVLTGDGCYGSRPFEWVRFWRFFPGMKAIKHEPPEMERTGVMMGREQTSELGISFDHYAYATRSQVAFKELYYKYPGAVEGWDRLQANTEWPCRVRDFLPWVTDDVMAVRI